MNLFLTITEGTLIEHPLVPEKITQENLDGLLYVLTLLPDQATEFLRLRFEERQTYSQIGKSFGFGGERVRQIILHSMAWICRPALFTYLINGKPDKPQTPIKDLGLPSRVFKLLLLEGCIFVEDLIKFKKKDIEKIQHLGETSIHQIASKLESMGIAYTDWSAFRSSG